MTLLSRLAALSLLVLSACAGPGVVEGPGPLTVASPDGRLRVAVDLDDQGTPTFEVTVAGEPVTSGTLGLVFAGSGRLGDHLRVVGTRRDSADATFAIPVGKASEGRDHHRELVVMLEETAPPNRRLDLAFRAFDDGVAFRYQLPEQDALASFVLLDELTQFTFPGDPTMRAMPLANYTTAYEAYYETGPVSTFGPDSLLAMPVLLGHTGGAAGSVWMAVTEANLTDYAGMYLSGVDGQPGTLAARLSPLPGREDGAKVLSEAPHVSPWRTLMIAADPGRLIESDLVFALSDPSAIEDVSWIGTGKTTFGWWNGYVDEGVDFDPGVNTATMKRYIDFCVANGIPYHTLDGYDIAWYGGPIKPQGRPTDVTTAAPSIDMPELLRYAGERGVRLRLWVHWEALKPQLEEAFATYEAWGIEGVMVDFMDRDDQEMVQFYHEMAETAARHHLTLSFHGAYKPTGMERTWPNVLSYEGVLNQEYNKWTRPSNLGTPPSHNLDAAFIRMLAGPLDYHQGGVRNVLPESYHYRSKAPPVQGTRAHQLAMYVVYQNHLSMMADYPEAYAGQAGVAFMAEVPTNWEETRVLVSDIDEAIVVARRSGADWYIGGMVGDEARTVDLALGFLEEGTYEATVYEDDPSGEPTALTTRQAELTASDGLRVDMSRGGGVAVRLVRRAP